MLPIKYRFQIQILVFLVATKCLMCTSICLVEHEIKYKKVAVFKYSLLPTCANPNCFESNIICGNRN